MCAVYPSRCPASPHTFPSPKFLQIRLGNESCDQISASPNRPKRAKSRDKTTGSLFTRIYTLVEFSQTKRCFFSFFITKHTKTNDTSTSLSFTQHNSYFVKNNIIFFILLVLSAYSACDRQLQTSVNCKLAISVSQHCERAFRTPVICLCAPHMKRHSLTRSIEPKEGHKTTGASKNIFNIWYLMYRSQCSL